MHKTGQHLASRLQQGMADDNLQEALQPISTMLNHVIAEPVRKDLAGQLRDRDARTLPLQDVPEVFEIRVAASHATVLQLEGRDVRPADDLVVGVHLAADAVGLWIADLF